MWAGLPIAILVVTLFLPALSPQTTIRTSPPLVINSMSGGDLFRFYCGSCHGVDGRGHGPVATSLRTPPPDLTTLTRRHGAAFPRATVELYLTGDEPQSVVAHGTKDMPVWGPIFRALDPDDATRKVRLANIVDYMQSIQAR